MKNYKYLICGFAALLLLINCKKDKDQNKECTGTISSTTANLQDRPQWHSTVDYYNKIGLLVKSESSYTNPVNSHFDTYTYNTENQITEHFSSLYGTTKYFYEGNKLVKKEYYGLRMIFEGYTTFEYSGIEIIGRKDYSGYELDTTDKFFYNNGLLDSVVTILSGSNSYLNSRLEYKYDEQENIIERSVYSNNDSEEIRLDQQWIYTYEDNSNLKSEKNLDENGILMYGNYSKYSYDDLGNLIKTEYYNSTDSLLGVMETIYQYCDEIKLIKPKL